MYLYILVWSSWSSYGPRQLQYKM